MEARLETLVCNNGLVADNETSRRAICMPSMHQNRRRKKRSSYGVRTVELVRSRAGFGFTISGQSPCILSCIVSSSPAERAGLRPGDYLIAVNGHNVSKVPHDDVVRLIGGSTGTLKLQIAENYYSNSSDDEFLTDARPKTKHPHRFRHRQQHNTKQNNPETTQIPEPTSTLSRNLAEDAQSPIVPRSRPLNNVNKDANLKKGNAGKIGLFDPSCLLYSAVVGYLGTVEIPTNLFVANVQQSAFRNCIRRLKVEKKVHSMVALQVYTQGIVLVNRHAVPVAHYPAERIAFCGAYVDDKNVFGLVTEHGDCNVTAGVAQSGNEKAGENGSGGSCHVFMVYPGRASLQSNLPADLSARCPESAEELLQAVSRLSRGGLFEESAPGLVGIRKSSRPNPGPVPLVGMGSSASSAASSSSNSDSGIGFRGRADDRVFVVEMARVARPPRGSNQDVPDTVPALIPAQLKPDEVPVAKSSERLTVRAMPDPVGFLAAAASTGEVSFNTERLDAQNDANAIRRSSRKYVAVVAGSRPEKGLWVTPEATVQEADGDQEGDSDGPQGEGSQDVHPPTHDEDTDTSGTNKDQDCDSRNRDWKWSRPNSLRQRLKKKFASHKDHEASAEFKVERDVSCADAETCCGDARTATRVELWAVGFEKLLEDVAGIHSFAEFLKKEYSQENINFWIACERYRKLSCKTHMKLKACEIFEKHLGSGALEPVNVDSQAVQAAAKTLYDPLPDMFDQAQRQIFNLMKFDSYVRFLKSPVYKECTLKEAAGDELPFVGDASLDPNIFKEEDDKKKMKRGKDTYNGEERRRKSLLPWNRTKSMRNKNGDSNCTNVEDKSVTDHVDTSRLVQCGSECGSDENIKLCRVTFPDQSTTTVNITSGENVRAFVQRVLARRAARFSAFDVFVPGCDEPLDVDQPMRFNELRFERRVVFHVKFSDKKTVAVTAVPQASCNQVFEMILQEYGYKMNAVEILLEGQENTINMAGPARELDKKWIVIKTKAVKDGKLSEVKTRSEHVGSCRGNGKSAASWTTLDELTSAVFDDLMKGRSAPIVEKDGGHSVLESSGATTEVNNGAKEGRFSWILHRGRSSLMGRNGRVQGKSKSKRDSQNVANDSCVQLDLSNTNDTSVKWDAPVPRCVSTTEHVRDTSNYVTAWPVHPDNGFKGESIVPSNKQAELYFRSGSAWDIADHADDNRLQLRGSYPCPLRPPALPGSMQMHLDAPLDQSGNPPSPPDTSRTSIDADMADFSPPAMSILDKRSSDPGVLSPPRSTQANNCVMLVSNRPRRPASTPPAPEWLRTDPPPLPPKPHQRRPPPPPRPPFDGRAASSQWFRDRHAIGSDDCNVSFV